MKSQLTAKTTLPKKIIIPLLAVYTLIYVITGLNTQQHFVKSINSISGNGHLSDFAIYERAAKLAIRGESPYFVYFVSESFLYPPPSLFLIEPFLHIQSASLKFVLLTLLNAAMIIFVFSKLAKRYEINKGVLLFTLLLLFTFAPFLELIYIGQINVIILLGIFLMFYYEGKREWLSGFGLALAVLIKITPVILALYLAANRRFKELKFFVVFILLLSVLSVMRYGVELWLQFPPLLVWLTNQYPIDTNSQSTISNLLDFIWRMQYRFDPSPNLFSMNVKLLHLSIVSVLIGICLLTALGIFFKRNESTKNQKETLLIVLLMAMTLMPNIVWYHHYLFLTLALAIWVYRQKLTLSVSLWCLIGLLLIQIDRFYLTGGLLVHIFVYISLGVLFFTSVQIPKLSEIAQAWNLFQQKYEN